MFVSGTMIADKAYVDSFIYGQGADALSGQDDYDIPNPPPPPAPPYLDLYSLVDLQKYSRDVRPFSDPATATFYMRAEELSGIATMTWNIALSPVLFSYIILQDVASGIYTDMRSSSNYIYNSGLSEIRKFNLYLKSNNSPSVQVAYPNNGEAVGGIATITAIASDMDGGFPYNDRIASVTFQYSTSPYVSWNNIGPGALTSGTQASGIWSASWNTLELPALYSYKVRAIASDTRGASAQDESDNAFSITKFLWKIDLAGSMATVPMTFSDNISAGAAPWANAGLDILDILNPPAPPAPPYLDMYFISGTDIFSMDVRPHLNPTTWNLRVNAAELYGPTTISATYIPPDLANSFVILQDNTTGISQNLKSTPSYTYNSTGAIRNFNLLVRSNNSPSVQVSYPDGGSVAGIVNCYAQSSDPDGASPYNDRITSVIFQYASSPYTNWYSIGTGTLTSGSPASGVWSASWNTLYLAEGTNYKIRAIAADSFGATVQDDSDASFTVIHKILTGATFLSGWNMYSFPFYPDPNTITGQLGDDITVGLYAFHYNPDSGIYALTDTASAGWGYWTKVSANTPVYVEGLPVSVTADYELTLGNGWNQIGSPFNAAINWGNVKVRKDGVIKTMSESHILGWVTQWLYSYNPSSGTYDTKGTADGVLTPFVGYWVKSNVAGATLIIPHP